MHTDIHALRWIRTHDPSVWAGEDSLCFRLRGHCDRRSKRLLPQIIGPFLQNKITMTLRDIPVAQCAGRLLHGLPASRNIPVGGWICQRQSLSRQLSSFICKLFMSCIFLTFVCLHSPDARFKSRPVHRLFWACHEFSQSHQENPGLVLQWGHDHFLPNTFQFNNHPKLYSLDIIIITIIIIIIYFNCKWVFYPVAVVIQ
jgi:hypothetical protein